MITDEEEEEGLVEEWGGRNDVEEEEYSWDILNSCNSNIEQMQMERNGGIHVHSIQPCLSASLSSLFSLLHHHHHHPNPSIHQLISTVNHLLSSSFLLHQIKTQKTNPSLFPFSSFSPLLNQLPPPVKPPSLLLLL